MTLLTLPVEIRHQILTYLLRSYQPLSRITRVAEISHSIPGSNIKRTNYWRFETGGRLDLYPSVLSTCAQLYLEGCSILYSENTVLVSIAMYESCQPVEVLGHWRFDNLLSPAPGSGLPPVSRFRNFEFRVYISFPRFGILEQNELSCVCTDLARVTGPGAIVNSAIGNSKANLGANHEHPGIGSLNIYLHDGNAWENYRTPEAFEALWLTTLEGFSYLKCREVTITGDAPSSVSQKLKALLVSDLSQREDHLSEIKKLREQLRKRPQSNWEIWQAISGMNNTRS